VSKLETPSWILLGGTEGWEGGEGEGKNITQVS
jgi:hypothetical protein